MNSTGGFIAIESLHYGALEASALRAWDWSFDNANLARNLIAGPAGPRSSANTTSKMFSIAFVHSGSTVTMRRLACGVGVRFQWRLQVVLDRATSQGP